jgi:hypothetical protein
MNVICNIQAIKRFLGKPVGECEFRILSKMSEIKLEEIREEWLVEYNEFLAKAGEKGAKAGTVLRNNIRKI